VIEACAPQKGEITGLFGEYKLGISKRQNRARNGPKNYPAKTSVEIINSKDSVLYLCQHYKGQFHTIMSNFKNILRAQHPPLCKCGVMNTTKTNLPMPIKILS